MISGPDGIPVVRRRTSRQLERKRDLDKIAQREKRAREKELWRKMENDMAGLQQEVNLLRDTIRSIQNYTDCKTSWHPTQLKMSLVTGGCAKKSSDEPSNARNGIEQLGPMVPVPNDIVVRRPVASENSQSLLSKLPFTDTEGLIQLPKLSEFDTPPHVQATSHTQSLFARLFVADDLEQLKCVSNTHQNGSGRSRLVKELVYPDEQVAPAPHHPLAPSPSPNSDSAGVLNTCWCALGEHATQWDCYEEHIYRALMNWHNGPGLNPPISVVSRTPTLPNLLFFEGGNVIVDCLNNVLKWSAFPNLSVQFGTYIYSYRLLRVSECTEVELLMFACLMVQLVSVLPVCRNSRRCPRLASLNKNSTYNATPHLS